MSQLEEKSPTIAHKVRIWGRESGLGIVNSGGYMDIGRGHLNMVA